MPPKPRGRPPKKRCNLAGLQNNHSSTLIPSMTSFSQGRQTVSKGDEELISRSREPHKLAEHNKKNEASSEAEDSGEETDMEDYESNWDELDDQDFAGRLAELAMEDDLNDFDWVPAKLHGNQKAKKKGKTYIFS